MKLLLTILFVFGATATVVDLHAADSNTVSSTVVTNNTPPTANSPSVVVNNSDVCTSGYSGSVQTQVLGISSGVTIKDANCEMIKLSRSLFGMGMKVAAVSTLCADYRIFDAMWMSQTFCPYMGAIGEDAKQGWLDNRHMIPEGSKVFVAIAKKEAEDEKLAKQQAIEEAEEKRKADFEREQLLRELEPKKDLNENDIKKLIIGGVTLLLLL
tara:strand:+ start:15 stop:650 length:636 start_codon:yes stop_codon:yes gene_type:complete